MPSKEGWTHDLDHDKITLGRKAYRNMEEWSRPCAVCGEKFSIFVRASGGVINSSFGLRTCKVHRGERPGAYGSAAPGEVQTLRSANVTMREELTGLYERMREQFEELQVCKAKLASFYANAEPFVLSPEVVGCEPVQNTTNSALPSKLPWE